MTTGAASVMTRCAAELLAALGAKVYAADMHDMDLPVEKTIKGPPRRSSRDIYLINDAGLMQKDSFMAP